MTVAFRSSANVVNGTAGTSVVVTKPTGTVNGDMLIAFIAEVGTGSITKPAGWNLIGSQAASTNVTVAAYWKLAASEGANWTWTLGSSVRNWGWVGAYTGVDPTSPISASSSSAQTSAGTSFSTPAVTLPAYASGIYAVGAVRTAGGSATTWTPSGSTERADMSTNGGAGTDVAGSVGDFPNPLTSATSSFEIFTASQSQSSGAMWTITLNPFFTPYDPSRPVVPVVEAAFGADPSADPATWTWTDISTRVRRNIPVTITKGRQEDRGEATPTGIRLTVNNFDGAFTPDNPNSTFYPNITRNLPIRVSVPVGYAPPTERATAFVTSASPKWDASTRAPLVEIVADGRLRRMQQGTAEPLRSALYRSLSGSARGVVAIPPQAYWPCEDGSGATSAASAVPGVAPLSISGTVNFGGESTLAGSAPLLSHGATWRMNGLVPGYTATGQWCATFVAKMPSPFFAGDFWLLRVLTTGTAAEWRILIAPGAPDAITIRAFDATGAQILTNSVAMDESTFYGAWHLFSIGVKQNGANVDYILWGLGAGGGGKSGTLNSYTHGNVRGVAGQNDGGIDAVGFGHLAIFTDPSFDNDLDPDWLSLSLDGFTGESAYARFQRLSIEEGIDWTSDTQSGALGLDTTIAMGPQPISTLAEAYQQAAAVDQGVIHDGGPSGALTFSTRAFRYGRSATLSLDGHAGGIGVSFAPTFDDQKIRNDITIKRTGGSSARYANDAHALAEGRYREAPTLNLGDDTHLYEIAGWQVNLGTTPGMRVPQLTFSLRRNASLAAGWLASRIGVRVAGTNLPTTYGPSTVDAFIEGYTEVLSELDWTVTLNCSPARPYDVMLLNGSANTCRLDTSGSTLASAPTPPTTGTSLSVATPTGALWQTGATSFDLEVAGERMTVTNITGATSPQTFTVTRSVNAVVKAQSSGATVKLWHPNVIAL